MDLAYPEEPFPVYHPHPDKEISGQANRELPPPPSLPFLFTASLPFPRAATKKASRENPEVEFNSIEFGKLSGLLVDGDGCQVFRRNGVFVEVVVVLKACAWNNVQH